MFNQKSSRPNQLYSVIVNLQILKKVKPAVHQFSVKGLFAVCTTTYSVLMRLSLYFIKMSFLALSANSGA